MMGSEAPSQEHTRQFSGKEGVRLLIGQLSHVEPSLTVNVRYYVD